VWAGACVDAGVAYGTLEGSYGTLQRLCEVGRSMEAVGGCGPTRASEGLLLRGRYTLAPFTQAQLPFIDGPRHPHTTTALSTFHCMYCCRAIHTPPLLCNLYIACIVAALLAAGVCMQVRAAARRRRKEAEEVAAQETRARVLAAAAARRSALAAEAAAAAAGPPPTGRTSRT
jgi:hypothetical protein